MLPTFNTQCPSPPTLCLCKTVYYIIVYSAFKLEIAIISIIRRVVTEFKVLYTMKYHVD